MFFRGRKEVQPWEKLGKKTGKVFPARWECALRRSCVRGAAYNNDAKQNEKGDLFFPVQG
jgi:hypothetical protein